MTKYGIRIFDEAFNGRNSLLLMVQLQSDIIITEIVMGKCTSNHMSMFFSVCSGCQPNKLVENLGEMARRGKR